MPALDNQRWEQFAQFIVAGETQAKAYQLSFGLDTNSVDSCASELIRKQPVADRILELRKSGLGECAHLSLKEKLSFLASIVRTAPGQIDENDPRCQSYKKKIRTERDGTTEETIEYELPNKLKALELAAKLAGEMDGGAGQSQVLAFFQVIQQREVDAGPVVDI